MKTAYLIRRFYGGSDNETSFFIIGVCSTLDKAHDLIAHRCKNNVDIGNVGVLGIDLVHDAMNQDNNYTVIETMNHQIENRNSCNHFYFGGYIISEIDIDVDLDLHENSIDKL